MIKVSVHQGVTILNMYSSVGHNNPRCLCTSQQKFNIHEEKFKQMKGEINKFTITAGDFGLPSNIINIRSKQKISEDIVDVNN